MNPCLCTQRVQYLRSRKSRVVLIAEMPRHGSVSARNNYDSIGAIDVEIQTWLRSTKIISGVPSLISKIPYLD